MDRLIREERDPPGEAPTRGVEQVLDEVGRRLTLRVLQNGASQWEVSTGYDDADNVIQIQQGTADLTTFEYDPLSRLIQRTLPNGIRTNWAYNDDSQLTSVLSRDGGKVIDSNVYTPDAVGNISQAVVNGVTWTYLYDDLYRLKQATITGGPVYSWQYDLAGNRLSQSVDGAPTATYEHDAANRLIRVNGAPLTYDANGNLTGYGNDTYTWNVRDELVGLSRPGLTAAFLYDFFGRRETKTINGVATSYLWDGEETVAEYPTSGSPTYTVNSPFLDEPISRGDRFLTPNHLGSTTTLTNSSSVVVERYVYGPWGETWASAGVANPVQFTGRENDGTGLRRDWPE